MKIQLLDTPIDAWALLSQHQQLQTNKHVGATNVFIGTMRDLNQGDQISQMFLEHYPQMAQHYLTTLAEQACQEWNLKDLLLIHRYGIIVPQDTIVVIGVWSEHRREAFEACRYLIEELKQNAPFWKKETLSNNSQRWVSSNTVG